MNSFLDSLTSMGQASLNFFWFPLVIWTILALIVYAVLKLMKNIDALYQYHIRIATLAALPAGLFSWSVLNWFLTVDSIPTSSTKIIMVVNPITIYGQATATEQGLISQLSPGTWLGMLFAIILLAALFQGMKFIRNVWSLHIYKKAMDLTSLTKYGLLSQGNRLLLNEISTPVQLAITSRPQVPYTFGWIHPVIVIPALLTKNKTKLNLAIRHELTHIRRRDYVVGFWVHLVSKLFVFHPLVWFLSKEINEYSEISCDDAVLADTTIPAKHYAYLLLEMLQLPVLNRTNLVNMANPISNIKKRINAMTITKHKNKSIGVSLSLFVMILAGISMIMALSGLQNQAAFGQSLPQHQIVLKNPRITINGQTLDSNYNQNEVIKGPSSGIFFMRTSNYGTFLVSGQYFKGARQVGNIKDKVLYFTIKEIHVNITSIESILLSGGQMSIWARQIKNDQLKNLIVVGYGSPKSGQGLKTPYVTGGYVSEKHSKKRRTKMKETAHPFAILGYANSYRDYLENNFSHAHYPTLGTAKQKVYTVVTKMPKLIGGLRNLERHIIYPDLARRAGIKGRVYVEFVVDKKGNVTDPKVVRGIGGGCDKEALKLVKKAHFIPGMQNGQKVNVRYSLPIVFKLYRSQSIIQNIN